MKGPVLVLLCCVLGACSGAASPTRAASATATAPPDPTPTVRATSTSTPAVTQTPQSTPRTSFPTATEMGRVEVPDTEASVFAYESQGAITLASSDGEISVHLISRVVSFASHNASPVVHALASLGGGLAFASQPSDQVGYQLWHYRPNDTPQSLVMLEGERNYIESVAIAHDGSRIAYSVLVWHADDFEDWYEQLWVVEADGSDNRLVADRTGDSIVDPGPFRLAPVAWSQDLSKVYMVTNTDSEATPTGLYVADVTTGAITKANTPDETLWRAMFSPDRTSVAYSSFQWIPSEVGFPEAGPPFAIKVTDLESGRTSVIWESDTEPASDPVWSPDGGSIAFSKDRNAIAVLQLADGSLTSVLVGGPEERLRPGAWLSDGRIVYTVGEFGSQLMTVRFDGSEPIFIDQVEGVHVLGELH